VRADQVMRVETRSAVHGHNGVRQCTKKLRPRCRMRTRARIRHARARRETHRDRGTERRLRRRENGPRKTNRQRQSRRDVVAVRVPRVRAHRVDVVWHGRAYYVHVCLSARSRENAEEKPPPFPLRRRHCYVRTRVLSCADRRIYEGDARTTRTRRTLYFFFSLYLCFSSLASSREYDVFFPADC